MNLMTWHDHYDEIFLGILIMNFWKDEELFFLEVRQVESIWDYLQNHLRLSCCLKWEKTFGIY